MKFKKVGVLLGGISAERPVSLESGRAVAQGLRRAGYDVMEIDVDRQLDRRLRQTPLDGVYIALHGRWGEDGTVQGMLEMMGIPYTGSSVLSSSVAMDKALTRNILKANGLPICAGFVLGKDNPGILENGWSAPVVVKPANEGSSLGVTLVHRNEDFSTAVAQARAHSDKILVERLVEGVELTVAVLNGEALGALEIESRGDFYDYASKYEAGGSVHHIPPRIPEEAIEQALKWGKQAYDILDCSGAARVDLIVPDEGPQVIIEVNTIPGMTETSLLPEIAEAAGIPFDELVSRIMETATLHVR